MQNDSLEVTCGSGFPTTCDWLHPDILGNGNHHSSNKDFCSSCRRQLGLGIQNERNEGLCKISSAGKNAIATASGLAQDSVVIFSDVGARTLAQTNSKAMKRTLKVGASS